MKQLKFLMIALFALFMGYASYQSVNARPPLGVTNFDSVHLRCLDCATATPALLVDQASGTGGGNVSEWRVAATPILQAPRSGGFVLTVPTSVATGVPGLVLNNKGAGNKAIEVQKNATPVFSVSNSGSVSGQVLSYATTNQRQFCATNTITDTASYTATVTAISTPVYVTCSMNAITGDANNCAAIHGVGNITVTVRNSAATPVANATGAAVTWCVIGTPQ